MRVVIRDSAWALRCTPTSRARREKRLAPRTGTSPASRAPARVNGLGAVGLGVRADARRRPEAVGGEDSAGRQYADDVDERDDGDAGRCPHGRARRPAPAGAHGRVTPHPQMRHIHRPTPAGSRTHTTQQGCNGA